MTSVDPSHFPPLAQRARHIVQPATASARHHRPRADSASSTRSRSGHAHPLPTIPDLRFEQAFLKTISPYLQTRQFKDKDDTDGVKCGIEGDDGALEVVGVQWGKVLWIVSRDQLMSPLLQGAVWGVLQLFIRPLSSRIMSVFGFSRQHTPGSAATKRYRREDGELTRRLREWSRSLTGGFEANVALAK